jgi:hypothetical protein
MGRSPDVAEEAYSDGTYERELINEVGRHLYKANIGQTLAIAPPPSAKSKPANPATNYASAFRGRFRNMVDCSSDSIKSVVKGTPYSVSTSRLWASLISIILQYDVVIDVNPQEHKAVFARRLSIPDPAHPDTIKRADVLMVVLVEPATEDSCTYYLAALDEDSLSPTDVVAQRSQAKDDRISLSDNIPDFMKAAAIVSRQLDQQIDMQMFYTERWGNKFLRRSGATSTNQP